MAVNEGFRDHTIRSWLQEPVHLPEDRREDVSRLIRATPQQRHRWSPFPAGRSRAAGPSAALAVAGVVVAVVGSVWSAGVAPGARDPESAPAAALPTRAPDASPLDAMYSGPEPSPDGMVAEVLDPAEAPPTLGDRPRSGRTYLIIEQRSDTMVQGQRQRLTARWCRDDDCRPADDVRWESESPKVLQVSRKTGSWTVVEARGPGVGHLAVGKGTNGASPSIFVYPRPGAGGVPVAVTPRRVEVAYPREAVVGLGQHLVVTGWRCSTNDAGQLGRDGVPGTDDDDCRTRDISDVTGFTDSGMALVGMVGPSAVVSAEEFTGLEYPLAADPVRLSYSDREEAGRSRLMAVGTSHVYVRDARWEGPLLGDLDGDGLVDDRDVRLIEAARTATGKPLTAASDGRLPALDLNTDHRVDEVDAALLEILVASHAGTVKPKRLVWYMSQHWLADLTAHLDDQLPEGWEYPAVVRDAIDERRVRDVAAATEPAIVAARTIIASHEASSDPALLDAFRTRFESAATVEELRALLEDAGTLAGRDPPSTVEPELLAELPDGADPDGLVQGPRGGAIYVDRATATVNRADTRNGMIAIVVREGDLQMGTDRAIGVPVQLAAAGPDVVIVDDKARPWRWRPSKSAGAGTLARIKLQGRASFGDDHGDVEAYDPTVGHYRLYVAEPSLDQVLRYQQRLDRSAFQKPSRYLASAAAEVADYDAIYVDFDLYALSDDALRRYQSGRHDGTFALATLPDRTEPDYRLVGGSGRAASDGRLYLYDALHGRIVGFSKLDGSYLGQWLPERGGTEMDDVRGMYVIEGGETETGQRQADTLVWVTPEGVYRAVLPARSERDLER